MQRARESDQCKCFAASTKPAQGLYTDAERRRRDSSPWTLVQAILAPLQFLVFLVSLGLVLRTLATGEGAFAANASIILKTLLLYTIMVTGSLWEKDVFGKYLFAPAFFWEDAVSFIVIALHTAYLICLLTGALSEIGPAASRPRRLCGLCGQCRAVPAEAARGTAERQSATSIGGGSVMNLPFRPAPSRGRMAAPMCRCCASAASAKCSAA